MSVQNVLLKLELVQTSSASRAKLNEPFLGTATRAPCFLERGAQTKIKQGQQAVQMFLSAASCTHDFGSGLESKVPSQVTLFLFSRLFYAAPLRDQRTSASTPGERPGRSLALAGWAGSGLSKR